MYSKGPLCTSLRFGVFLLPRQISVQLLVAELQDSGYPDPVSSCLGNKVLGGLVVGGDERDGRQVHPLGDGNDGL